MKPASWRAQAIALLAEKIGIETTTYVRNIFKYYTSYKLSMEAQHQRDAARGQVQKK